MQIGVAYIIIRVNISVEKEKGSRSEQIEHRKVYQGNRPTLSVLNVMSN